MKRGEWDRKTFVGVELQGKTLGIVGFGRIGQRVAARARAFEMQVVAFDPFLDPAARAAARTSSSLGARRAAGAGRRGHPPHAVHRGDART